MITKSQDYYCFVEINGTRTKGQLVLDKNSKKDENQNKAIIIKSVSSEFFKTVVTSASINTQF